MHLLSYLYQAEASQSGQLRTSSGNFFLIQTKSKDGVGGKFCKRERKLPPSRPSQKQGKEHGRTQGAASRRRTTGLGSTASQARTPSRARRGARARWATDVGRRRYAPRPVHRASEKVAGSIGQPAIASANRRGPPMGMRARGRRRGHRPGDTAPGDRVAGPTSGGGPEGDPWSMGACKKSVTHGTAQRRKMSRYSG